MPRESSIQRAILAALAARGVWAWRNNSGMIPVDSKRYGRRMIKLAPTGSPDILGVLSPGGYLFGLEVKQPGEQQRPSQVTWQRKAESNGVRYAVVRSVVEAMAAIDRWRE